MMKGWYFSIMLKNIIWVCAISLGFKNRNHGYVLRLMFKEKFKG
jgi:hypothetical protein